MRQDWVIRLHCLWAALTFAVLAMGFPSSPHAAHPQEGLEYLNRLRRAAGMVPFTHNRLLDRSAQDHADYLSWNRAIGHGQRPGRRGYTGREPGERVRHAGYPHRHVAENVAAGETSATDAVDGLMAAIYHRLGFLSFDLDEIGIGLRAEPGRERWVFNMGHAGLSRTCTERPAEARYQPPGAYYTPCRDDFAVAAAYYDAQTRSVAERNPRVVLWPPADADDVPPAFFNETPDPLPDYEVSGYPVSVQFNPVQVRSARLVSFRLFAESGSGKGAIDPARLQPMAPTRVMSQANDPHGKFSPLEFALFPLQRLDWDRPYVAEVRALVDGKEEHLRWRFRTRHAGAPLYVAEGRGEVFPVLPGRTYAIYLPPTARQATLGRIQYSGAEGVEPTVDFLDGNTLRVRVAGPPCASVTARLRDGRYFALRIAAKDATAGAVAPEELYATCPEFAADYRIRARGELLDMAAGRDYLVHVAPSVQHPRLTGFRYRMPAGLKPKVAFASPDALRIRVEGERCSVMTLEFEDGRSFRVRVGGPAGGAEGAGNVRRC